MTADVIAGLRSLAEALPTGVAVPVPREWLLELLAGQGSTAPATPPADLTVREVAVRYGRHDSTVRQWLERGLFPGAYKLRNRDWRVPPAAIAAFDQREREGESPASDNAEGLGDWRGVAQPAGVGVERLAGLQIPALKHPVDCGEGTPVWRKGRLSLPVIELSHPPPGSHIP